MKLDAIGTLFSNAWRRLQERFSTVAQIFLVPLVLIVISQLLFANKSGPAVALGGLINLLAGIVSIASSVALISAFGKNTDFTESYRAGLKLFWSEIWVCILAGLAVIGGFVLLVVPGIILGVQLAFVSYALVLDGKRGMVALAESREYIKGYWWAFFGRAILLGLCFAAATFIFFLPTRLLLGPSAAAIVYGAMLLIYAPFTVAYHYEIFDNLRRLKPQVSEEASRHTGGFLKAAPIVGLVGLVVLVILFFVAIAFFAATIFHDLKNGQLQNGQLPDNWYNNNTWPATDTTPWGMDTATSGQPVY